ncbi:MAG: hypothetical protein H6Q05_1146 [Acidobacteria bacterium]|nr:hypothetical protein [Acidobacteriota bacterium]
MNSSAVDNGHGRNCGMSGYMAYNGAHLRRPHSGAISDEELVRRSLLGEDEAFAQLYERYKQPITATMTRIMRDRTEAQDATQEVFLKMYRALPAWDSSRAKFSTWVYRLAANHAIDCWRLRRRRAEVFLMEPEKMADAPSHAGVFRGMGDHSLEKRVEQNEKLAEIRRCLNDLPRSQRRVFILRLFLGLRLREIAEREGYSLAAVKGSLYRAIRMVQQRLRMPAGFCRETFKLAAENVTLR